MVYREIKLNIDERKARMLESNYEGTIEGYLESELDTLLEEVVPVEELMYLHFDIEAEEKAHDPKKFAVIRLKNQDDICSFMTKWCKTALDFAKDFARNVYEEMEEYSMKAFIDAFGDYESISNTEMFDIFSQACGKENNIGVVATVDVGKALISIQTDTNPQIKEYDIHKFYNAISKVLDEKHALYQHEVEGFEKYLELYNAEILPTPSEQSEEPLQMQ